MRKTKVKNHRRKIRNKLVGVRQHNRRVGSKWSGQRYIHGPRKHSPSRYSEFRLGKPTKEGKRLVFGRVNGTDKWEVQSKLTPKNRAGSR